MATNTDNNYILSSVVDYLRTKGITIPLSELEKHVNTNKSKSQTKNKKQTKKPTKFLVKQKENEPKRKDLKFKVKVKDKNTVFNRFVDICIANNLLYFQFNDELSWKGPAIKIDLDTFDNEIFQDIDIHILEGYGFGILRPKAYECDKFIKYDEINYNNCILTDNDSTPYNSEDECQENSNSDDSSEEEVYTEQWKFEPTNTLYQLDPETNNVYCNQTYSFVGKRIDDHNIDFDAKED